MLIGLFVSFGLLYVGRWAYRKWQDKKKDIVAQSGEKDFTNPAIK